MTRQHIVTLQLILLHIWSYQLIGEDTQARYTKEATRYPIDMHVPLFFGPNT